MNGKDGISKRLTEAGLLLGLLQGGFAGCRRSPHIETILTLLKYNTQIGEKALAEMLGTGVDRLDRWLEQMEREGLVSIAPEEGGLMMEVSLTRFGAREADRIEKANEKTERLLDCLSEEERARLSELLDKLLAKLKKELEDEDGDEEERAVFRRFFAVGCGRPRPFFGRPGSRMLFGGGFFN